MGLHRPTSAIAVALAAAACLAGCTARESADAPANGPSPAQAPSSQAASAQSPTASGTGGAPATDTMSPRTGKWIDLQAGDCLADVPPTDPAVVMVTLVDCSQPHLAEAFLRAPIPVDAALEGTANTQCEAGFVEYTGGASATSPYTITYLIDSHQDRTFNNPLPSTVICLLQNARGESLTGSARG